MSKHRAEVRPRYGRIAALGASLAVTVVALMGAAGVVPTAGPDPAAADPAVAVDPAPTEASTEASPAQPVVSSEPVEPAHPLPDGSGSGRRAVFDQSEQRVWLVNGAGRVVSTYAVSGSLTDNLQPGTYQVFSRSADAVGIDGSTMKWFVRFTRGPSGAAIGFHDLPVDDGEVVQTLEELGTPQSHGCIRQKTSDAKRMWRFAPLGTTVVVTA